MILRNRQSILLFLIFCICAFPALAGVVEVRVGKGQVVTQAAKITPGFAALFELPSEIVSLSIADQTTFTCSQIPPDKNKILCKALTSSPYATNMILTTDSNEFNIILSVDDSGSENPFKYVFRDESQKSLPSGSMAFDDNTFKQPSTNILDQLLNDYSHDRCSSKASNSFAEIRCVEMIQLGTNAYLKFIIHSFSKTPFNVVNCDVVTQTLGGVTGLAIKKESPASTQYVLKSKNMRFGEESFGIIKIPNVNPNEDQRLILTIYTDLGKEGDLKLKL